MIRRYAAALGAILALGGCSATDAGSSAQSDAEPPLGSTPAMLKTAGVSFPLDAYEATPEQQDALSRAQHTLTGRCMTRFGFTFQPPQQPPVSGSESNTRVFGLVDPDTAARYGYLNPSMADTSRQRRSERPLTETEQLALMGEDDLNPADLPRNLEEAEKGGGSDVTFNGQRLPVGGCIRESFLKLYARKANEVDILFVFNLKSEAESKALEDSRVRAASKRWSECMAKAGYTVNDPMKAPMEMGFSENAFSSPRAITAAKADVRCKQQVNLVGVRYTVTVAYQKQLIEKHAETLSLVKQQLESRLTLAASLAR
ncbi:hypothetical protein [Streptomyces sp. NPDC012825]|uniref:hypothetical protein n=1 Tax=Streptomyces sp. NPDC012825 TaxID=3364851 RepID=UPI003685C17D